MIQLRPYQERAIEEVRTAIRRGARRILLVIPTGGGKTLTSAKMVVGAIAKDNRTLFVAHRTELIDQTYTAFLRLECDPSSMGVIRAADKRRRRDAALQICSIQTLARRDRIDGVRFIVIDEAHRSSAKSYIKYLREAYPDAIILGLTATPIRADGRGLGSFYDTMIIGAKYSELLGEHIVQPDIFSTPMLPDLTSVRTTGGDYNAEDLEAAVDRNALIGDLWEQWRKRHGGRRTVCFAVSVAHSRHIVELFREKGIVAEHLDGTTPEPERKDILRRLERGETKLVSNVGVLCEGWDCPAVKMLILARPTKSLGLYMQMVGRVLRPWESLTPIINDHGGCWDRHGGPTLDREWSLEGRLKKGGAPPQKVCQTCFAIVGAATRTCPHCGYEFLSDGDETLLLPKQDEPIPVDLALRTLTGEDAQLRFFKDAMKRARRYGLKPGFVKHRWLEQFPDVAMPESFRKAVYETLHADEQWRDGIKGRQERKRLEVAAERQDWK